MTRLLISEASHVGMVRANQEDTYLKIYPFSGEPARALLAVADGMGGHEAGEVASLLAVETLQREIQSGIDWHDGESVKQRLSQVVEAAHLAILAEQARQPGRASMGTTLSVALIDGEKVYIAQTGDSRIYRVSGGKAVQLTHDHSVVGELVRAGAMTEEEAMTHPHRNLITASLGGRPFRVEVDETVWHPGDILLLCTDGLTNLVTSQEVAATTANGHFDDVAARLVDLANSRGGHDNITVLAVRWDKVGEQ